MVYRVQCAPSTDCGRSASVGLCCVLRQADWRHVVGAGDGRVQPEQSHVLVEVVAGLRVAGMRENLLHADGVAAVRAAGVATQVTQVVGCHVDLHV